MDAAHDSTSPPIPIFRRRTSSDAATNTTTATSSSSSSSSYSSSFSSSVDFELVSIKPTSYTSLRDILPSPESAVQSRRTPFSAAHPGYEISIRNRLVKQAAWFYLQPMSTSPEADGSAVFHRLWTQFSGAVLRLVTTVFGCLLKSIQVGATAFQL